LWTQRAENIASGNWAALPWTQQASDLRVGSGLGERQLGSALGKLGNVPMFRYCIYRMARLSKPRMKNSSLLIYLIYVLHHIYRKMDEERK
jgi:hypothetical protein